MLITIEFIIIFILSSAELIGSSKKINVNYQDVDGSVLEQVN